MYYNGEEYKEAHKWKTRAKSLRSDIKISTRLGVQTFGRDLTRSVAWLIHLAMKIVSRVCIWSIIIFAIATITNISKMGFCADILHTRSFLFFAVSFVTGIISYIIMIATE